MQNRPKIQLQLSSFDKFLEKTGILAILILWVVTVYAYINLPDTIPTHFNFSGKPDSYGAKATLFLLPVLGTLIFFGFSILSKRPHIFNYPTTITAANAKKQYGYVTRMLRILKTSILFILIAVVIFTSLTATGKTRGFSAWFLPCIIGFILIPVGYYITKSFAAK